MSHKLCDTCPKKRRKSCRHRGDPFHRDRLCKSAEEYASQDYVPQREILMPPYAIERVMEQHRQEEDAPTTETYKHIAEDIDLSVLTDRQREVIHLTYWEELTQRKIAERLGITRQRVGQIQQAALLRLKGGVAKRLPNPANRWRGKISRGRSCPAIRCPKCQEVYDLEYDWDRILVLSDAEEDGACA